MFYVKDGNAYFEDGGGAVHGIDVTAVDKVVTRRELASVSYETVGGEVELPAGAKTATLNEIVAKFGISEENPLHFAVPEPEQTVEPEQTGTAESMSSLTRDELVAKAEALGLKVKSKATKDQIAAAIAEAEKGE